MAQKILGQVDMQSGEIMTDGFVAYVVPKRKNGFIEGWIAMSQGKLLEALANADLGLEAHRVFLMLIAHVEYENFIVVPQTELAEKLKMDKRNFSRALSKLIAEGIIQKGPKMGRMVSLKLNPNYGWKGTAKNHVTTLNDYRKKRDEEIAPKL